MALTVGNQPIACKTFQSQEDDLEINLENEKKKKPILESLPIGRDHLSVKSGQIGMLEKVIV